MTSPFAWPLIGFVKLWRRFISPLYGDVCKFYPTCSAYGLEALELHGAVKGSWLILRRLARCHPWSLGGVDPVPGSDFEARLRAEHDHDHRGENPECEQPESAVAGADVR